MLAGCGGSDASTSAADTGVDAGADANADAVTATTDASSEAGGGDAITDGDLGDGGGACSITVIGSSSNGPFDLLYEGGNTHIVYLATNDAAHLYRERKSGSSTFAEEATFLVASSGYSGYSDVSRTMHGSAKFSRTRGRSSRAFVPEPSADIASGSILPRRGWTASGAKIAASVRLLTSAIAAMKKRAITLLE
jgi:hypothetical protein